MAQIAPSHQAQGSAVSPPAGAPPQLASASLYVGDLDPSVAEAQLYDIFNQLGPVVSIRICRDLVTRRSLGYAYVNYSNAQDASRAMDLFNYTPINGKTIRIMYSHRDPSLRKSGTANIFIKNLDKSIDNKALYDTFSAFGPILSCKVASDSNGLSKGYGFVQFEMDEAAQSAIDKVNGMLINDKQVFVGPFIRRQERELANAGSGFNNVYVKDLSESTTDEDLRNVFGEFGPISSVVVMRDADGRSKCFGFVNFENTDDAANAVEALNGKKFRDREWYVCRAQKKSERETELRAKFEQVRKERFEKLQGANLYLKNLDDTIDDEKLKELFSNFGTITSCKVMRDPTGQSRGSGFVAFCSSEEASRAVKEMNGKMISTKPIYVALAQSKEERQARLQAQFSQMHSVVGSGPAVAPNPPIPNPPIYHPEAPAMGQQVYYGQPPPGLIASQPLVPGIRPGPAHMPNYFMPTVQRPGQQALQRLSARRIGSNPMQPHQQPQIHMFGRGANRGYRYNAYPASNMPDTPLTSLGRPSMDGVPPEMGAQLSITAVASILSSAPPEQHRAILGEQLYPLVDQLEHDHAGKITGMLLEMDQSEVLHLIESPEALKAKVLEAMDVLRMAQVAAVGPVDRLAALSLNGQLVT